MGGGAERPLQLEPVRTVSERWLPWLYSVVPAVLGVIGFLAWRQAALVAGLALATGAPVVIAIIWWRVARAALWIDADGRLHRTGLRRQRADLRRLRSVSVSGSVPYPDQRDHERYVPPPPTSYGTQFTFRVEDDDGGRVTVAPSYTWVDEGPVLRAIIAVLVAGRGRCDPLCWEFLHRSTGQPVPPFPDRLLVPPPDAWGQPLRIRRIDEAARMTPIRYLGGAVPLTSGGLAAIFSSDPVEAVLAAASAILVLAMVWLLTDLAVRRAARDVVTIDEAGRLTATTRHAWSPYRFGYRLTDGEVVLGRLQGARFVAGTRRDAHGHPRWWNLELDDDTGGHATIDLFHRREPEATFYPQLVHHLEAAALPLDAATHDGLGARFGRPLTNPRVDRAGGDR